MPDNPPTEPKVEPQNPPQETPQETPPQGQEVPKNERDLAELPDWARGYIEELRTENKNRRDEFSQLKESFGQQQQGLRQALGLEDQEQHTPEEVIDSLLERNEQLEAQNAYLGLAQQFDIPLDKLDYFTFLMNKAGQYVEEDQEIPEEEVERIINEVKSVAGQTTGSSSVGKGQIPPTAPVGSQDGVTYESFKSMNMIERSKLYHQNKELYNQFMLMARQKGELVS